MKFMIYYLTHEILTYNKIVINLKRDVPCLYDKYNKSLFLSKSFYFRSVLK